MSIFYFAFIFVLHDELSDFSNFFFFIQAQLVVFRPAPGSELWQIKDCCYQGVKLTGNNSSFTSSKANLCDDLQESLKGRFEDVSEGVLEAAQIASLPSWPDKKKSEGKCYLPN